MKKLLVLLATGASVLAFAPTADAYLHEDNCRAALLGNPGDNDIAAYRDAHRQTGWSFSGGSGRAGNNRVWISLYFNGWPGWSDYPGGIQTTGYCVGDDGNLVDKVPSPPAGW